MLTRYCHLMVFSLRFTVKEPAMKKYFYTIALGVLLISCGSSKNSASKTSEDKALISALKKLDKNPDDPELKNALSKLYAEAAKVRLDNIEVYSSLTEITRWDKIIREYEALNQLTETISGSTIAYRLIKPVSYTTELSAVKQKAADEYYDRGISYLSGESKTSARSSYSDLKKANSFVPGYKDVVKQINIAFEKSIINVVINPIRDNSFYSTTTSFDNFNEDDFQRNLVRDLGGIYNKKSGALFFTQREARSKNITPDWEVDLSWTNITIPTPTDYQSSRNLSKQVETGRDSSGKAIYQTVTATLYVVKKRFTATGDIRLTVTDLENRETVTTNHFSDQYDWQEEYATYRGDSKALSTSDWALVNNTRYQIPRNREVINELSRRIYTQVKNRVYSVVAF